jgi:hypothetical protein
MIWQSCVNREMIVAKLHFYGIQEVTADWLRSYLTKRRQKVEIKLTSSIHNLHK